MASQPAHRNVDNGSNGVESSAPFTGSPAYQQALQAVEAFDDAHFVTLPQEPQPEVLEQLQQKLQTESPLSMNTLRQVYQELLAMG